MPRNSRRALALAVTVVTTATFAATQSRSADITSPGSLTLTANYNTVQFKFAYDGDDNQNASVFVRYWKTSSPSAKDTAVVPTRDVSNLRFTGVIFWLDESVNYTVEAKITDPDGLDLYTPPGGQLYSITLTQTITTRSSAPPNLTGDSIWVSPSGNNSNAGSQGSPLRTIAAAYDTLRFNPSRYHHIRLLPGVYYETFPPLGLQPLSGTSSNYYSIKGVGDPASIVIDGSDTSLLHDTTWTALGVNSIYYRIYPNARTLVKQVTAGVDQRLHPKASDCPRELVDYKTCVEYPFDPDFPHQGYRIAVDPNSQTVNDTLLVRLENGDSPNDSTMHVSIRPTVWISGAYWLVQNLTTRFSSGAGIFIGNGLQGCIVRGCTSYNNAAQGVFVNNDSSQPLIDACTIWDGRIGKWSYFASKLRLDTGAILTLSANTVVRGCTITGTANGIQVSGSAQNPAWGSDSDVYYNKITNQADDGLENDFNQGVNVAVWGNFIRGTNNGWSQTTADIGPTYVIYNVFDTMVAGGIKLGATPGSGDSAHVFYYHNTFTSSSPFHSVGGSGPFKNQVFANNIMVGVGAGYPNYRLIVATDEGLAAKAQFDYDLNWHVDHQDSMAIWWVGRDGQGNPQLWSFQQIRDVFGFETHGKYAAPTYVDSASANFRPLTTSPQVDMGARIQGINTPYKTRNNVRLYAGLLPDAGAYEYNYDTPAQPPTRLGPAPIEPRAEGVPVEIQFALGPPHPNPVLGGTAFQLTLAKRTDVDAGIYDVSGRQVRVIAARRVFPAGRNELTWDGRDDRGRAAPTGMYFLRVQARTDQAVRRVMVLR